MQRGREKPLSVRFDAKTWGWLRRESERRGRSTGTRVGPSTIVRAIVEREAKGVRRRMPIDEFRKRWKVARLGFEPGFFEALRDRSPGRDIRL